MGKEISDANQQPNFANCQAELKLARERALQIEAWEKIALTKLTEAQIKISEHQSAHHQTHLRLIQSLSDIEALNSNMHALMQARDRDMFWRLANPIRKLIGILPRPMVVYSRKSLKLLYWVATPWKMKARLQHIKNRNNAVAQEPSQRAHNTTGDIGSNQKTSTKDIVLNHSAKDLYEKIQKSKTES